MPSPAKSKAAATGSPEAAAVAEAPREELDGSAMAALDTPAVAAEVKEEPRETSAGSPAASAVAVGPQVAPELETRAAGVVEPKVDGLFCWMQLFFLMMRI